MALPLAALGAGLALGGIGKSVIQTGLNSLGHFINGASNLHWHKQQSEFDQQQQWETMDKQAAIVCVMFALFSCIHDAFNDGADV